MIKVTEDLIKHLEELAKVGTSEEERKKLAESIQEILDYMKLLDEVDVSNVEIMYTPIENSAPLRKDEVRRFPPKKIIENFPEKEKNQAKVPPILG
ncbi:MAG: Asp-tRNA(Asn)/Glu-tRNA(Gln) amidotransferase subunit GatC [Thermotogaceae bacterium]|nr:Asp-tRNA(Asn)/Glu-tRNA(Gln) amidotransferase subunit GatC [Thermotogaceae bacterium]